MVEKVKNKFFERWTPTFGILNIKKNHNRTGPVTWFFLIGLLFIIIGFFPFFRFFLWVGLFIEFIFILYLIIFVLGK